MRVVADSARALKRSFSAAAGLESVFFREICLLFFGQMSHTLLKKGFECKNAVLSGEISEKPQKKRGKRRFLRAKTAYLGVAGEGSRQKRGNLKKKGGTLIKVRALN